MNDIQVAISALALFGVGGVVGAYFQNIFQSKREIRKEEHGLKQARYKAILILMLAQISPQTGLDKVRQFRADLRTIDDVKQEIHTELLNAILFAGDEVLVSMAVFIDNPNYETFADVAASMRKDLWGKNTKIAKQLAIAIMPVKIA
jgi:hypothetical protein